MSALDFESQLETRTSLFIQTRQEENRLGEKCQTAFHDAKCLKEKSSADGSSSAATITKSAADQEEKVRSHPALETSIERFERK